MNKVRHIHHTWAGKTLCGIHVPYRTLAPGRLVECKRCLTIKRMAEAKDGQIESAESAK